MSTCSCDYPGENTGLSQEAIIGISVPIAISVLVLFILVLYCICCAKITPGSSRGNMQQNQICPSMQMIRPPPYSGYQHAACPGHHTPVYIEHQPPPYPGHVMCTSAMPPPYFEEQGSYYGSSQPPPYTITPIHISYPPPVQE